MKTGRKLQLFFALFALVFTSVFLLYRSLDYVLPGEAKAELELYFLDVGQGDSSLIRAPGGQNILIDGGDGQKIISELSKALPWHERTIDLMILTHPHDDHVGGLIEVLNQFYVNKILYTGISHTSSTYLEWLGTIKEKNIPLTIIDREQVIDLGAGAKLEVVYPREDLRDKTVSNLNNSSIVIRLVYDENKVLFMGDIEEDIEQELIESGTDLSADVIKVGHHGSDTSSGEAFVLAVSPEYAVMSLAKDNKFGHPSLRVVKRYERAGAEVLRTDVNETVSFVIGKADGIRRR